MTLRETEAPKNSRGTLRTITCCLSLTECWLSPSSELGSDGEPREQPTMPTRAFASAHPARRCLGLGGGSGGGGRSHRIGRVQRQTCWLITELLLSIPHSAELSRSSGAEAVSFSRAGGVNRIFCALIEPFNVICWFISNPRNLFWASFDGYLCAVNAQTKERTEPSTFQQIQRKSSPKAQPWHSW